MQIFINYLFYHKIKMLQLNKNNFEKEIKDKAVVIDCYADWCAPCRILSPIFEEISKEVKNVKFFKLDVDENSEIASKYSILSIPTILLIKNGKEVDRIIGLTSKENLKSRIEKI